MCMITAPAPASAIARAISGSRNPVTSFTIVAPAASAARATSGFLVSTLNRNGVSRASASITGTTRRSSSPTGTSAAPGRVLSPPMSRMSAPSSASCRA